MSDPGRDREILALAWVVRHPQSLDDWGESLQPQIFRHPYVRQIFSLLVECYNRRVTFPLLDEARYLLDDWLALQDLTQIQQAALHEVLLQVYTVEVSEASGELLSRFLLEQGAAQITQALQTLPAEALPDELPRLRDRLDWLSSLGGNHTARWLSVCGTELVGIEETLRELYSQRPVPLGFPRLDERLQGGVRPGEVGLLVGSVSRGKSMLLQQIGVNQVEAGRRVIYFSFDDPARSMEDRFWAMLSRQTIGGPVEVNTYAHNVRRAVGAPHDRLIMVSQPPKIMSVRDMSREVRRISAMWERQDLALPEPPEYPGRVDLVLVDYMDQVRQPGKYEEERFKLKEITEGLVAMARQGDFPVLTATQTNREALKKANPTMGEIAEAFNKTWAVSQVYLIGQTDQDRLMGRLRLVVAKTRRRDCNYIIPLVVSYATLRVAEDPQAPVVYVGGEEAANNGRRALSERFTPLRSADMRG